MRELWEKIVAVIKRYIVNMVLGVLRIIEQELEMWKAVWCYTSERGFKRPFEFIASVFDKDDRWYAMWMYNRQVW